MRTHITEHHILNERITYRHFDILNAIEFPKVNVIDLDLFNEFVNSNYMIDEDDNLLLKDSEFSDY